MANSNRPLPHRLLGAFGPAIIVAAVVLGPGSILTSSKVGCQYGYRMLWVLAAAGGLMIGVTALASRLGVSLSRTLCGELAARLGRPFAVFVGLTLFVIVACFQSSNNIAVLASIEPFFSADPTQDVGAASPPVAESERPVATPSLRRARDATLLLLNGVIIATLYGFKRLYRPLERLMMLLVLIMLGAFAANLAFSAPRLAAVLQGLVPQLPIPAREGLLPELRDGRVTDPLWAIQGLVATTFSIGGAFYQGYLVREKGWTIDDFRQGLTDSITGISALVAASAMIMITSAAVLHGIVPAESLNSAADVASQLEPLFGTAATTLFLLGILAAALSSFLVNAMVGGTLLSDGLGWGSSMDEKWPKRFTVAALLIGAGVALATTSGGMSRVGLIIFAQALTVLGGPVLAFSLVYLATRSDLAPTTRVPAWMKLMSTLGGAVVLLLAIRTAWRLYLQLS